MIGGRGGGGEGGGVDGMWTEAEERACGRKGRKVRTGGEGEVGRKSWKGVREGN